MEGNKKKEEEMILTQYRNCILYIFQFYHDFIIKKSEEEFEIFSDDETNIENINKESFLQNICFRVPRIFYYFLPCFSV